MACPHVFLGYYLAIAWRRNCKLPCQSAPLSARHHGSKERVVCDRLWCFIFPPLNPTCWSTIGFGLPLSTFVQIFNAFWNVFFFPRPVIPASL